MAKLCLEEGGTTPLEKVFFDFVASFHIFYATSHINVAYYPIKDRLIIEGFHNGFLPLVQVHIRVLIVQPSEHACKCKDEVFLMGITFSLDLV